MSLLTANCEIIAVSTLAVMESARTDHLAGAPETLSHMTQRMSYELFYATKNFASGPGYPFQVGYEDLSALLDGDSEAVIACAICLLLRYMVETPEEFQSHTRVELNSTGRSIPSRIFIKQEPHPLEKITQGRLRVVISDSVVHVLVDRFLLGPIHRKMIRFAPVIATSIGLGLTDEMMTTFLDKAGMTVDECGLWSSDQSGFDWNMYWFFLEIVCSVYVSLSGATGRYRNAIYNSAWSLINSYFVLSDGRMYFTLETGIRRSGGLDTGHGNSISRVSINLAARIVMKEMYGSTLRLKSALPSFTMGDDCCESFGCVTTSERITEVFRVLGFRITDLSYSEDGRDIEFCSMKMSRRQDGDRFEPLSWPRMLFRLLSSMAEQKFLDQFKMEMRHAGSLGGMKLGTILSYLEWVGWSDPLIQAH
jgi:hypothetical protein